jgi:hypothetical protein
MLRLHQILLNVKFRTNCRQSQSRDTIPLIFLRLQCKMNISEWALSQNVSKKCSVNAVLPSSHQCRIYQISLAVVLRYFKGQLKKLLMGKEFYYPKRINSTLARGNKSTLRRQPHYRINLEN